MQATTGSSLVPHLKPYGPDPPSAQPIDTTAEKKEWWRGVKLIYKKVMFCEKNHKIQIELASKYTLFYKKVSHASSARLS